jgi:hypothetical protein
MGQTAEKTCRNEKKVVTLRQKTEKRDILT